MNEWNPDDLIEKTWSELKGEVPRSRICELVTELADRYEDAKVKSFIPILIRRQVIELLDAEREIVVSGDLTERPGWTSVNSGQKTGIG
jgi:hypothetical protein